MPGVAGFFLSFALESLDVNLSDADNGERDSKSDVCLSKVLPLASRWLGRRSQKLKNVRVGFPRGSSQGLIDVAQDSNTALREQGRYSN